MKYKLRVIKQPKSLTFYLKNKDSKYSGTFTFSDTHINFQKAQDWLVKITQTSLFLETHRVYQESLDELIKLNDITIAIAKWSDGDLLITRTGTTYKKQPVKGPIADFLLKAFLEQPDNVDSFKAWSQYLKAATNPNISNKVTDRLFLFLSKNDLHITERGTVLAWKVVRPNYKDKHSNTFDNSVGAVPTMPRNKVNDDDSRHCSYGLHVCSWNYLKDFASTGDPVMQVEVELADIVSIPLDYNGEKVRVCKYKVLAEAGLWNKNVSATNIPKHSSLGFSAKV